MMDAGRLPWFVAIGASGGEGLEDLQAVMRALPSGLDAIVLIVLHRPWDRLSVLAQILDQAASMPVQIASTGERFRVGHAYVGEPADHLTLVERSFGELVHDPLRQHANRTVDLLFRSVAAHGGNRMIGIVLSGSLDDGSRGLAAIKEAGGHTMVLTPAEPRHRGMPENAIAYDGPIDLIGSPREIVRGICALVQSDR